MISGKQLRLPLAGNSSIVARFMAKVLQTETGHWLWAGAKSDAGYGKFKVKGKTQYAHRVSYALFKGTVPRGREVMHASACNQEDCVNPECLSVGTRLQNARERWGRYYGNGGRELTL